MNRQDRVEIMQRTNDLKSITAGKITKAEEDDNEDDESINLDKNFRSEMYDHT